MRISLRAIVFYAAKLADRYQCFAVDLQVPESVVEVHRRQNVQVHADDLRQLVSVLAWRRHTHRALLTQK